MSPGGKFSPVSGKLAGDGRVLVISDALIPRFGTKKYLLFDSVKITFDVFLVVFSTLLALIFLNSLAGVREGTIAAALVISVIVNWFTPLIEPLGKRWSV